MSNTDSGVTRVGDTRAGNWGCHPLYFSWKSWRPFLVASSAVSPLLFSPEKLTTFFPHRCHFYWFHSGVTPLEGVTPHLFYLSDLVSPLFFVNLPTIFFLFGCHPLEGVTRGGPPLVTPLVVILHGDPELLPRDLPSRAMSEHFLGQYISLAKSPADKPHTTPGKSPRTVPPYQLRVTTHGLVNRLHASKTLQACRHKHNERYKNWYFS